MAKYGKNFNVTKTPQSQPIPGTKQVENSAGGYTWKLDDFARLNRFLVLGNEGGTYYATENKLTRENAECVVRCIREDGTRTVATIAEISLAGRAPKNDPAIFALALCVALGDQYTRAAALRALPQVCRIGTHLFTWLAEYENVKGNAGYGRSVRTALANWYTEKDADKLAVQLLKYQQRNGWSHKDVLRLAHPQTDDATTQALFRRTVTDTLGVRNVPRMSKSGKKFVELRKDKYKSVNAVKLPQVVESFDRLKLATSVKDVVRIVEADKNVTWEMVPTEHLASPDVWQALLKHMPLTAMIRNLGRMTANGAITRLSDEAKHVVSELTNDERIRKARVHPIQMLSALKTYESGHGVRGSLNWNPISQIVDALDEGFYKAFGNVVPTGKNILLALDVSGSMGMGTIAGVPGLNPRVASAAMAMVTARTEKNYAVVGFTSGSGSFGGWRNDAVLTELNISPRQRLDDIVREISDLSFGGTDCALPMIWAHKKKLSFDAFQIWTDNETWAGKIHPAQALKIYRKDFVKDARLIVVGMTATEFTIADPTDPGMLDVVGMDTATPQLISDFIGGVL